MAAPGSTEKKLNAVTETTLPYQTKPSKLFTGRIVRSANAGTSITQRSIFFRHAEATRCTDGVKYGSEESSIYGAR